MNARFKIDLTHSGTYPFGLYFRRKVLFWREWEEIDRFENTDKARALYERVKDLPEYLP